MASKIGNLKKKGMPQDDFAPEVEAGLEEPMEDEEMGEEDFEPMMDEEEMPEEVGGGVEAVIDMLQGLSPEELAEVSSEVDMLMEDSSESAEDEFEGEDFEMEDESEDEDFAEEE